MARAAARPPALAAREPEQAGEAEQGGDVEVEPQAEDVVGGVDAERLLEDAAGGCGDGGRARRGRRRARDSRSARRERSGGRWRSSHSREVWLIDAEVAARGFLNQCVGIRTQLIIMLDD